MKKDSDYIERLVRWIITVKVSAFSNRWTSCNSLFSLVIIGSSNIYLETFFEDENEIETCVNIYKDKECYLAYGGTWDDCIKQINEHIIENEY